MAFPLLISKESNEVVERLRRRETCFSCWPGLASDQSTRAMVATTVCQEVGVAMPRVHPALPCEKPRVLRLRGTGAASVTAWSQPFSAAL